MTENKLQIGDQLPHFILKDESYQPINISFRMGKFLVLYFYPKDDTPGCIKEACSFRDSFQDFIDAGAFVYGISSDNPTSHALFKAKYHLPFSLLSDNGGELRKLLGVPTVLFGLFPGRSTYIFDPEGQLVKVFNLQLSPERHVKEALKAIENSKGNF